MGIQSSPALARVELEEVFSPPPVKRAKIRVFFVCSMCGKRVPEEEVVFAPYGFRYCKKCAAEGGW